MVANIELRCVLVFLLTIANEMFIRAQYVGSPSNVSVCINKTATTSCHFEYDDANNGVVPHVWILNGSNFKALFSVSANESKYGFSYPPPGKNDSEAILIVPGDQMFDGCRLECRLAFLNATDSPNPGTIRVIEHPSCPEKVSVQNAEWNSTSVNLTWQQSNTQPLTSTTVTFCPKSSLNCGNSVNCTSPCTISGLEPGTEYQFTVIPNNKCGTPPECTENKAYWTTKNISITPPWTVNNNTVKWLVSGVVIGSVLMAICFASMIILLCCRYSYKSLKGCLENVKNGYVVRATKNKVNDAKRKEEIRIRVVDISEHTGSSVGTTTQVD